MDKYSFDIEDYYNYSPNLKQRLLKVLEDTKGYPGGCKCSCPAHMIRLENNVQCVTGVEWLNKIVSRLCYSNPKWSLCGNRVYGEFVEDGIAWIVCLYFDCESIGYWLRSLNNDSSLCFSNLIIAQEKEVVLKYSTGEAFKINDGLFTLINSSERSMGRSFAIYLIELAIQ